MGVDLEPGPASTPLGQSEAAPAPVVKVLSARERQVSADRRRVDTYRRQIMDKLSLRSVAELTKYALREGLTSLD